MDSSSVTQRTDKSTGLPDRLELDPRKVITVGSALHNGEPAVTYVRKPSSNFHFPPLNPAARPHIYQPLPPGCVRFLKRSPQPDPDVLVFEFLSCPLKSIEDKYAAVSYCWGTLPTTRSLRIADGSYISVSAKVEEILTTVMSRIDHNIIWLDAVCINQRNMVEKALQIPLIGSIYRCAASVEIWLDSGDASLGAIVDSLRSQSMSPKATFNAGIYRKQDSWTLEPYSTPEIVRLMWSPWFNRAWVVQEFCFGKNHQFHLEDITITPLLLQKVHEWGSDLCFGRAVDEGGRRCEIPIPPMIKNFVNLFSLRKRIQMGEQMRGRVRILDPLEDILCRFYSLKTTDPRDKIFAMLSFATGDCFKDIVPDYDRPAPDIYLDAMKSMLQRGSDFCLLGFAGLASPRPLCAARPDIPSWVPDFSAAPSHNTWSYQYMRFNVTEFPIMSSIQSHCLTIRRISRSLEDCVSMSPLSCTDEEYTALVLRGVCIDTVAGILRGDEQYNFSHMPQFVLSVMEKMESLTPYPSCESGRDVVWKTLIAANPECLERDPKGAGFDRLCNLVRGDNGKFPLNTAWEIEGRYYQTMITEGAAGSRGVFWTRSGYIGLAANGVEAGDEVWLIQGGRVPFIFRGLVGSLQNWDGDHKYVYRLVCEAYVHGIMNGESMKAMEKAGAVLLI
jgi:Heterokaryon incompatibility protein (HET)